MFWNITFAPPLTFITESFAVSVLASVRTVESLVIVTTPICPPATAVAASVTAAVKEMSDATATVLREADFAARA
jgi:metal-sulfur cluster biosynthetic enzyme